MARWFEKSWGPDRKAASRFAPEARAALLQAPFPGNVRQLQNVVERCVVLSSSKVIPKSLALEALQDQTLGLRNAWPHLATGSAKDMQEYLRVRRSVRR